MVATPTMGFCSCSMFCCALLYVHSSFAIIVMAKRELAALLSLSSCCLVIGVCLFLAVPWICLQFVIVVFPDHTHLLFIEFLNNQNGHWYRLQTLVHHAMIHRTLLLSIA